MAVFTYEDAFGNGGVIEDFIDGNTLAPKVFLADEFILRDSKDAGITFVGEGLTYGTDGRPTGGTVTWAFAFDQTGARLLNLTDLSVSFVSLVQALQRGGIESLANALLAGRDEVFGSINDDQVQAGAGRDVVRAGAGDDTIIGGRGNDVLRGEGGADVFDFIAGDGADKIFGFTDTNGANDDFILISRALYRNMDVTDVAQGALLDFDTAGSILLVGIDGDSINRSDFIFS